MIASRANDGAAAANLQTLTPYVPANEGQPGVYVPPSGRPAMTPTWGTVAPFGISSATLQGLEAAVPPPLPLTSQGYALQVLQTECEGSGTALPTAIETVCQANGFLPESSDEAAAALFWNDPGGTFQPPGHWVQIADNAASSQGLNLLQHAREDALVGEALSDAGSATWTVKYIYNLWRPVTAIHDCNDWNPWFTALDACDAAWSSLINTPPHPDYVAGHPAFSGAAATVLAAFFGADNIAFSSTSDAYCNSGRATTDASGNVIGCTLKNVFYAIDTPGPDGCNNAPTQYGGYAVTDPQLQCQPADLPDHRGLQQFFAGLGGLSGCRIQPRRGRHPHPLGGGECDHARRCDWRHPGAGAADPAGAGRRPAGLGDGPAPASSSALNPGWLPDQTGLLTRHRRPDGRSGSFPTRLRQIHAAMGQTATSLDTVSENVRNLSSTFRI